MVKWIQRLFKPPVDKTELILAGFCFFIFRDPRSTKSHFDAQIGHQFPICSVLFATFPSVTSSKEHQKGFGNIVFCANI